MALYTEWLSKIFDPATGALYDCADYGGAVIQDIKTGLKWRSAAEDALSMDGGFDPPAPMKLSMRVMAVTIRKKYGGSILNYSAAWDELFGIAESGNILRFEVTQADLTKRYYFGRITDMSKAVDTGNAGLAEIPISITCANPLSQTLIKPSILLADTGLLADSGLFADQDPDNIAITSTAFFHTVDNTGALTADRGPILQLKGPLTAWHTTYNVSLPLVNGQYQYVRYQANIAAGETVTIDSGSGDVYSDLQGIDAYSQFTYGQGQDYWMQVAKGYNVFYIVTQGYGSGARWSLDFRGKFG